MARSLWSGAISFGLINIPVSVTTSREPKGVHFNLIDKRDKGRIGYKQVNKATGKEVKREQITRAFEYSHDQYVEITDQDLARANPKATQTIDIEDFVNIKDVDLMYFEQPYYLQPKKGGEKGYELLAKVMKETGKVAIGRVVFHNKQHLVAILPKDDALILETLRYAHELAQPEKVKAKDVKVTARELQMAEKLVADMTSKWQPKKYKDTYYDDVMKMINRKVKTGKSFSAATEDEDSTGPKLATGVIDLMPLLKKSLAAKGSKKTKPSATRTSRSGH